MHILLDPNFDSLYLCTDHPTLVQNNVAFVIDLSKLKCKDDVRADDLGAWKCTGSRILKFNIEIKEGVCHIVSESSNLVKIRRQYHVHGTDRDFHRMIACVDTSIGSVVPSSRCLLQYWFESGHEHPVKIKSHGNSNAKKEPYCRTHPSTLQALKHEASSLPPKDAVKAVYNSEGGIMEAKSLGKLPRNREQISNIRRGINNASMCSSKGLKGPLF